MSKLIVITSEMHKIAEFPIQVKYRCPGNVIKYLPVEFEVFVHGETHKAIPLHNSQSRMLTNLPGEVTFQIRNGKICNCKHGTEEIVEDIVSQLAQMNLVEISIQRFPEPTRYRAMPSENIQPRM